MANDPPRVTLVGKSGIEEVSIVMDGNCTNCGGFIHPESAPLKGRSPLTAACEDCDATYELAFIRTDDG